MTADVLFFVAASLFVSIGQFARLLLTVVMVAISQAPSPESNPNPPLPVRGKVVHYTTFYLIGGEFVQQRIEMDALPLHWPASTITTASKALIFVPANSILQPLLSGFTSDSGWMSKDSSSRY